MRRQRRDKQDELNNSAFVGRANLAKIKEHAERKGKAIYLTEANT